MLELKGGGSDDDELVEDPLAEVDLSNILPSRTRRRAPPQPGAYLVAPEDAAAEDDDEDDDADVVPEEVGADGEESD